MKSSRSIDNDRIVTFGKRVFDRFFRRFFGLVRSALENFGIYALAHHFKLVDCGGTINIARDEHRFFTRLNEMTAKFSAHRGFARALKSAKHYHRRRLGRNFEFCVGTAHKRDKFVVYDFNDLLTGRKAFNHLFADRFFAHFRNEVFNDGKIYVGFEQRNTDFAHRLLDFKFGQLAF